MSVKPACRAMFSLALLLCVALLAAGRATADDGAAALRARYPRLEQELAHNAFGRPLRLESQENQDWLGGDLYAVVEHPFARLAGALGAAEHWCDILILHQNTKYCRSIGQAPDHKLLVHIGSKQRQSLASAQRVEFDLHVTALSADYLRVELHAPEGALGTRDYRILLEAVPLDANRSFIHLAYTYRYGFAARVAMQGYLATMGAGKVGFSVAGRAKNGDPVYVKGVRGVVERNTMRYYLAIDAYVATADQPADARLRRWFASTEQYAVQLHEMDEAEYLAMKREELERQSGK